MFFDGNPVFGFFWYKVFLFFDGYQKKMAILWVFVTRKG